MIIEFYALKCFSFGVFTTWYAMRKLNKKCKTFEIKEIQMKHVLMLFKNHERVVYAIKRFVSDYKTEIEKHIVSDNKVVFKNGSVIYFKSADNTDNLRGMHFDNIEFFDHIDGQTKREIMAFNLKRENQ